MKIGDKVRFVGPVSRPTKVFAELDSTGRIAWIDPKDGAIRVIIQEAPYLQTIWTTEDKLELLQ